ncbi:MAG: 7-carboxy-7-deazaguanine synthase [Candidatus Riflebacteria bacterium]|nr:7-carboxy-7-deazaguanine synthase [Candidatus Riflebacteria bacterium]
MYKIKKIFYSLQGEGTNSGRPAVFCRFSGCNLWSGLEKDRATAACVFCDTDFRESDSVGGGVYSDPRRLADDIASLWPKQDHNDIRTKPFVVLTGGEPLLQVDESLITALHDREFQVALETNGTLPASKNIDWITVSPKAGIELVQKWGNELKLVFPQKKVDPVIFTELRFDHFCLQPLDDCNSCENTKMAIDYCLKNPLWRLSLQTHKLLGID